MAISYQCNPTWKDYLKLLMDLLPPGYAWQWNESSVGRHLLAAFADELVRFHLFLCQILQLGIDQFKTEKYGWSSLAYEKLLLEKFNVEAKVSDWQMNTPTVGTATCESPLWDPRFTYFVIVTVPDARVIPDSVKQYLSEYKQSHTVICWRSHPTWSVKWDIQATTVDNITCESLLYEQDFHAIEIRKHPSMTNQELNQYIQITGLRDMTKIHMKQEPLCTL